MKDKKLRECESIPMTCSTAELSPKRGAVQLYDGFNGDEYNAIYIAILECGKDYIRDFHVSVETVVNPHYDWLTDLGVTSITVELVDKLNELGFVVRRR